MARDEPLREVHGRLRIACECRQKMQIGVCDIICLRWYDARTSIKQSDEWTVQQLGCNTVHRVIS